MKNIKIGKNSLSFDGVDDFITITNSPLLNTEEFTWYVEVTPQGTISKDQIFLTGGLVATYMRILNSRLHISINSTVGQKTLHAEGPFLVVGNTYKLAFTFNRGLMRAYVNNVLVASSNIGANVLATSLNTIGRWHNTDMRTLNGKIHEVRVFNSALEQNELANISAVTDSRLIMYLPFNEGSGTTTVSNVGNAVGTINGATWIPPKEVSEIKVMKDSQLKRVIGKVMTANGLKRFYSPIDFKTDFISDSNVQDQVVKTLSTSELTAGGSTIPVYSSPSIFKSGEEITITDGINTEDKLVVNRNLLGNTAYTKSVEAHGATSVVINNDVATISRGSITGPWGIVTERITKISQGTIYTLSFKLKTVDTTGLSYIYIMDSNEGNYISASTPKFSLIADGEWRDYSFTFTSPVTRTDCGILIASDFRVNPGDMFEIKNIKLEESSTRSDWSIAPEDLGQDPTKVISVKPITKNFKTNAIISRSNTIKDGKLLSDTIGRYTITGQGEVV